MEKGYDIDSLLEQSKKHLEGLDFGGLEEQLKNLTNQAKGELIELDEVTINRAHISSVSKSEGYFTINVMGEKYDITSISREEFKTKHGL